MVTLILFVLIFGVVVISHEFGHFLLAKANGIHVIEFSVGMGPNLFSFQKGDTKYSLKLLPIGGACMFEGEDGLNEKEDGEDHSGSFLNANVWARISTVLAGPIFNFILGFIIAFIMVNLIVIRDPVATEIVDGVSPHKSLEGCIGGVAGAALIGGLYAHFFVEAAFPDQIITWTIAFICAAGAVMSMVGDLAASAIKRNHNIKDYGKLIPGHGGIMDRFDSMTVTAPMTYFLAILMIGLR